MDDVKNRPLTNMDSDQIPRYTYEEDMRASRVVLVGGEGLTINATVAAQPAASQAPQIEIKEIQIPQIILQKEVEIKEIQVPQVVVQESVKVVEIPQIIVQKEVEVKTVEVPVIIKESAQAMSVSVEKSKAELVLQIVQTALLGIIALALLLHK